MRIFFEHALYFVFVFKETYFCLLDCLAWFGAGMTIDGIYTLTISDVTSFQVYCDMKNGGWTVFQRRQDNSVDFYRGWEDYSTGFGDLEGNHWLGLEKLYLLTSEGNSELLVTMETFEGESAEARYSSFSVSDAAGNYTLSVNGYTGSAGDSLGPHNGYKFSTYDNDNDNYAFNCAQNFKGAWWYNNCHSSNLNGQYLGGHHSSYANGINWSSFKGQYHSFKTTVMKTRRIRD